MEHPHPPEHNKDRDPLFILGEILRELEFEPTPHMAELHTVILDATRDNDPATALIAYDRYQEAGQELVETMEDTAAGDLALNIAMAQLLAGRGEEERCREALRDCADNAYGQGLLEVTDRLDALYRD